MKNKYLWIFVGIGFFLFLIPVSISFYRDYQVYKNGTNVEVTITSLPNGYTSKTVFMKFRLDQTVYDKKVNANFSRSHKVGEKIYLRYLPGYENNFLFLDDSPTFTSVFTIVLFFVLGVWSLYYAFKAQH